LRFSFTKEKRGSRPAEVSRDVVSETGFAFAAAGFETAGIAEVHAAGGAGMFAAGCVMTGDATTVGLAVTCVFAIAVVVIGPAMAVGFGIPFTKNRHETPRGLECRSAMPQRGEKQETKKALSALFYYDHLT
jgi:hypothetical protein